MTKIPPTTALDIDANDNCPECDAKLEMVSPPHGYECRGCGAEYHIEPDETGQDGEAETSEGDSTSGSEEPDTDETDAADSIAAGECPWCEEYSGSHIGQHASSAHPEAWAEYKSE